MFFFIPLPSLNLFINRKWTKITGFYARLWANMGIFFILMSISEQDVIAC